MSKQSKNRKTTPMEQSQAGDPPPVQEGLETPIP